MAATASARLEFRVRPEQKSQIEHAADVAGLPVSEFMRSAVEERSEQVLSEHDATTRVPAGFFDDLLAALDAPPRPHAGLTAAATRARDLVERS